MKIIVISDTGRPQVNGVVRTFESLEKELARTGHTLIMVTPVKYPGIPCPTYPQIRLAFVSPSRVAERIQKESPDAVHVATEGPLGFSARQACLRLGIPFTTSFTTRFPEYVQQRFGLPVNTGYRILRWFHEPAERVLVANEPLRRELVHRGFKKVVLWSRGVDTTLFRPRPKRDIGAPRPYLLYVGRIAVEKNLRDFLSLKVPGTKIVVGDGPQRKRLQKEFPEAFFLGMREGEELAELYASADVFVFPSRTDTFGLVMLEALASGVPVAAYPCQATEAVIGESGGGALHEMLEVAIERALGIDPSLCRRYAEQFTWERTARLFLENLAPLSFYR